MSKTAQFLLQHLTGDELVAFYKWIKAEFYTVLPDPNSQLVINVREYLPEKINSQTLIYAWHIISGEFPRDFKEQSMYQEILFSLPILKDKLRLSRYWRERRPPNANGVIIPHFEPTTAWNVHIGEAQISRHALERFVQYHQIKLCTIYELIEKFKKAFKNAISKKPSLQLIVKRIINNHFNESDYLSNISSNLRFIVLRNKEKTIATVERPK